MVLFLNELSVSMILIINLHDFDASSWQLLCSLKGFGTASNEVWICIFTYSEFVSSCEILIFKLCSENLLVSFKYTTSRLWKKCPESRTRGDRHYIMHEWCYYSYISPTFLIDISFFLFWFFVIYYHNPSNLFFLFISNQICGWWTSRASALCWEVGFFVGQTCWVLLKQHRYYIWQTFVRNFLNCLDVNFSLRNLKRLTTNIFNTRKLST